MSDTIIGTKISVLDKGFIHLIDLMGDDSSIVQAARVSYGEGTKSTSSDEKLIRYLMRHRHTTPFEMCEIKLHVKVPMDCWRQWIRHRTASVNEYSTRYSMAIDDMQTTEPSEWRRQSIKNKQGGDEYFNRDAGMMLSAEEAAIQTNARYGYTNRLEKGVAREQARKDLPLSTYTEAYWKIDLHNLLHFLELRLDSKAQYEIRQYASAISDIVRQWVPITWAAFVDYRLHAMTFSAMEVHLLREMRSEGWHLTVHRTLKRMGWLDLDDIGKLKPNRERSEFVKKAARLGIIVNFQANEIVFKNDKEVKE